MKQTEKRIYFDSNKELNELAAGFFLIISFFGQYVELVDALVLKAMMTFQEWIFFENMRLKWKQISRVEHSAEGLISNGYLYAPMVSYDYFFEKTQLKNNILDPCNAVL